jgi:ferredoxin
LRDEVGPTGEAMADPGKRIPENIAGAFYVDRECIDCDLCRETAPENFRRNEDEGYSFVFKQPESEEELRLCEEALEGCPVEAIGSDGEDGEEPAMNKENGEAPE